MAKIIALINPSLRYTYVVILCKPCLSEYYVYLHFNLYFNVSQDIDISASSTVLPHQSSQIEGYDLLYVCIYLMLVE